MALALLVPDWKSALSQAEDDRAGARSTMAFLGRGGRLENPGLKGHELIDVVCLWMRQCRYYSREIFLCVTPAVDEVDCDEFAEAREIYGERWKHGAMNKSSSLFSIPGPTSFTH